MWSPPRLWLTEDKNNVIYAIGVCPYKKMMFTRYNNVISILHYVTQVSQQIKF